MSRFQVGPLLRGEAVVVVDVEPSAMSWLGRPLFPDRCPWLNYDDHVPEQLSTADAAVAAWVADNASLSRPELAFRVICRAPDIDAFDADPLSEDEARAAVRELRAGRAVATSTVVRYARHLLETT